jgi:DNA repair protein RecN (Recombination protein N)
MLVELAIRNFAIIDTVRIEFGPGLNVLTGETGAGKSILLDALGAVLGERVSAEMVRTGARAATIDATISIEDQAVGSPVWSLLNDLNVEPDDGHLILSREIQSGGRSGARLNGRPTTASILGQIGALLVDIHGQSEHLSLLRPAAQLELLDRFAGAELLRTEYAARFQAWREARAALKAAQSGSRDRMQRVDLLRFQVDEINAAGLRIGEEEELVAERGRLVHAERLARESAEAYERLSGEVAEDGAGSVIPALRLAERLLADIGEIDPSVQPLTERLTESRYLLEDLTSEVRSYRDAIEVDPARLAVVEERLAALRQLQRKYGADIAEILEFGRRAEAELERLTGAEVDEGALAEREAEIAAEAGALAARLSRRRREAAEGMAAGVEQAIAQLNMGSATFAVALDRVDDARGLPVETEDGVVRRVAADATGVDRATFLIAPNPGEGLKPLSRIASGGETARLMLALKSVLSEVDQTPTLIFDEIDVGVGGRSGAVVGDKLWQLSTNHQVIVITHLPQIAAYADEHFRIAKLEADGRVVSVVEELEPEARVEELAAMLDGLPVTPAARRSAVEMLDRAQAARHGTPMRAAS